MIVLAGEWSSKHDKLRFVLGTVSFSTKIRRILNGGNLTLRLFSFACVSIRHKK
jgi:hypothetical protein